MAVTRTGTLSAAGRGMDDNGFVRRFKIKGTYPNGVQCQRAADALWPGCRAALTLLTWAGRTMYQAVPEPLGAGKSVPLAYSREKAYYLVSGL